MRKFRFHPCGNLKNRYEKELTIFETDFGRLWLIIGLFFLFIVIPFISKPYILYIINMIGITSIAVIGLNILIGFTGQISLGHGAFFGVGAYTAAILATRLGFPFLPSLICAGIITAFVGMFLGIPSFRLKGLYLTISTLAGQFIIEYLLLNWESLTKGTMGIIIPTPTLFSLQLIGDRNFFWIIYVCLVVMTLIAVNITHSKFGRAFMAIRDNDIAAKGMGIPIFSYKILSFGISSFYAGLAGGLWAYYTISITSEPFTIFLSIEYIAMVIIGGVGSLPGSIFGTIFITILNEVLKSLTWTLMNIPVLKGISFTMAPVRELTFGAAIIFFIIFEPKGLAEVWRIIRSGFRLWPFSY